MKNKTAIVSCFYTSLHGTKFGGRPGRRHHYYGSLKSLAKITNADFYIFCDPEETMIIEDVKKEFPDTNIKIIPYDLNNFYMNDWFEKYKDYEEAKTDVRCREIQYSKTFWLKQIIDEDYGYKNYYWIDAGISYTGLIPDKHIIPREGIDAGIEYFNSSLYCNDFINGLNKYRDNKLFNICIRNKDILFYRRCVDVKYYLDDEHEFEHHMIGGIFGGSKEDVLWMHNEFVELSTTMAREQEQIYEEETVYNVIWRRNRDRFKPQLFDIWYHGDNVAAWLEDNEERKALFEKSKSYYNILEELIKVGKKS